MAKKKEIYDICFEENTEECNFTDAADDKNEGTLVTAFSFNDEGGASAASEKIYDNRKTPIANTAIPSVNNEYFNINRTYRLRMSTIRKLNELKLSNDNLSIAISEIVDTAINYYHNYFFNKN